MTFLFIKSNTILCGIRKQEYGNMLVCVFFGNIFRGDFSDDQRKKRMLT